MTLATSYTELIGVIRTRIGELGIRYEDFDVLAGFAPGLSGKVFGPSQVKRLGPEKLFDALVAASIRIRAEPDPDQLVKMQKQIAENCQPRQANQARMGNSSSPVGMQLTSRVFKHYAKIGGKTSWENKSKKEQFAHQRKASLARWKKYRMRQKAAHRRRQRERQKKVAEVANV